MGRTKKILRMLTHAERAQFGEVHAELCKLRVLVTP